MEWSNQDDAGSVLKLQMDPFIQFTIGKLQVVVCNNLQTKNMKVVTSYEDDSKTWQKVSSN
jgi:hypothetical protein